MNDTNPYAAPESVEEDDPGYDLHKIARRYIRLEVALRWFVRLLLIGILVAIVCAGIGAMAEYCGWTRSSSAVRSTIEVLLACLFIPTDFALVILWYYGTFVTIFLAFALKYRAPAMLLMILGAIDSPFMILVVILVRFRAKHILRTANVVIINGKVDWAQIPVEEDY